MSDSPTHIPDRHVIPHYPAPSTDFYKPIDPTENLNHELRRIVLALYELTRAGQFETREKVIEDLVWKITGKVL